MEDKDQINFKLSHKWALTALSCVVKQVNINRDVFRDGFPSGYSLGGNYRNVENNQWTNGFWSGMLWLAYEMTGDMEFRQIAEAQLDSYENRLDRHVAIDHDLGFLYTLSAKAAYTVTNSGDARQLALRAAEVLAGRYMTAGKYIKAWKEVDVQDEADGSWMIIDCMMNVPLLLWASRETGLARYAEVAISHIESTIAYICREDGSCYHMAKIAADGSWLYSATYQQPGSTACWSRGQAWAIYGFALCYRYTGSEAYMRQCKRMIEFYMSRLPENGVCYHDLNVTEGPESERDTSAAAIAACGMLELIHQLPQEDPCKSHYEAAVYKTLHALVEHYMIGQPEAGRGVLQHGTAAKGKYGEDECLIYGDYFFMEALVRTVRPWKGYW